MRTAVWLVIGVATHVDQHFVARIEAVWGARTGTPLAIVQAIVGVGNDMRVRDVNGPLFSCSKCSAGEREGKRMARVGNVNAKVKVTT